MSPDLFPPNKFAILTLFKIEFDFVIVAAAAAAMIKAVVAVVAVVVGGRNVKSFFKPQNHRVEG